MVPEIAERCHAENGPLIQEVHESARITKPDVIAVTSGPGLITGLMVGVERRTSLSLEYTHRFNQYLEGHILCEITNSKLQIPNIQISNIKYPALALIASGGHTELILMQQQGQYERVGATKDDAAGECFDKVAKLLGFDYPGGPKISQFAETGNPNAIKFPRPMLARRSPKGEVGIKEDNLDFSFAGLKTSALYWLRDHGPVVIPTETREAGRVEGSLSEARKGIPRLPSVARNDIGVNDFCASFEQAIIDVLVGKTLKAVEKYQPKTVILGGGVAANKKLRDSLKTSLEKHLSPSLISYLNLYADNAAMIAIAVITRP